MIGVMDKDYNYASRVYKQKAIKKQVEDDIKTMVYTMLGNERTLTITKAKDNSKYDIYPSCKHWKKQFCRAKDKKWMGRISELSFIFYADSELGVYLEVLRGLLADQLIYPAVL